MEVSTLDGGGQVGDVEKSRIKLNSASAEAGIELSLAKSCPVLLYNVKRYSQFMQCRYQYSKLTYVIYQMIKPHEYY